MYKKNEETKDDKYEKEVRKGIEKELSSTIDELIHSLTLQINQIDEEIT
jgi:hypothetical protein